MCSLQDLIIHFQPPPDELGPEAKQRISTVLKKRQNMFQEEVRLKWSFSMLSTVYTVVRLLSSLL